MRMSNNYTSSRQAPYITNIHRIGREFSSHAHMLYDDLHCSFSIEFSPSNYDKDFYDVHSDDKRLKRLLLFEEYHYFDHKFDQMLSQVLYDLVIAKKTYIEIVISKDEKGDVVGLSLLPFDAVKYATINNISYFISQNHEKKYIFFKIPTCHYIEFDLKKLKLGNNYFKKLLRKLRKLDKNKATNYLFDENMKSKFDYDAWVKKQDFLILQYPYKIGWYGRHSSNKLLSESYLLYRSIEYKLFRQRCLEYLLQSINDALKVISDEIGANGKITVTVPFLDYKHEWQRYVNGEISASELSNIIYRV